MFQKSVVFKNEIEPNELFVITIKIPNKTEENDEQIDIKFDLCIGNNNLKEVILPCNFNFILSSLKIKIKCLNYNLIMHNDEIILGTNFLEENEIIQFEVKCKNENTSLDFKFSYQSNEENGAKEPILIKDKNIVNLQISNDYKDLDILDKDFELKLFCAILKIHITNELFIPIYIKAEIIPFKFKITAYNFNNPNKSDENELKVFYGLEQLQKENTLFFKITLSNHKKTYNGKIKIYPDYNIKLIEKSIDDDFEISDFLEFSIKYSINDYDYDNKEIKLQINININSYEKTFSVLFLKAPNIIGKNLSDNIQNFPIYHYRLSDEGNFNLEKLNYIVPKDTNTNIFVSPFEVTKIEPFEINPVEQTFKFLMDVNINKFYILNNEGKLELIEDNVCKWEIEEKSEWKKLWFIPYNKQTYIISKSLPLIGYYNGVWYPILSDFKIPTTKRAFDNYSYNDFNTGENIKNFLAFFEILDNKNKYNLKSFGNLFFQDKVFNNIIEIIDKLPIEIAKLFYEKIGYKPISEEIKKSVNEITFDNLQKLYETKPDLFKGSIFEKLTERENKQEDFFTFKKNVILTIIVIFKERYKELERNGFRDFILTKIDDKELFSQQVEQMRNEYFCVNNMPKIIDSISSDELVRTQEYLKKHEKKNEKYLNDYKNKNEIFEDIRLTYYNNKFVQYFKDSTDTTFLNTTINDDNAQPSSSTVLEADVNLPDINRPENDLTLDKLINFYNDAIRCTRILPIFIGSALKNDDKNNIKKAENYLTLLSNSYKAVKPTYKNQDTSFLKLYVNDFIFSFEKMISKLKKADLNIKDFDYIENSNDDNVNEILKFPEREVLNDKNGSWNIKYKEDFISKKTPIYNYQSFKEEEKLASIQNNNDYDPNEYDYGAKIGDDDQSFEDNTNNNQLSPSVSNTILNKDNQIESNIYSNGGHDIKVDNKNKGNNNQKDSNNSNYANNTDTYDTIDFGVVSVVGKKDENENGENKNEEESVDDKTNEEYPKMTFNSNAINNLTIDPKGFESNEIQFNESEGITKSILKIKRIDENYKFSFDYTVLDNYLPKNIGSQEMLKPSFKSFVESSHYISKTFIKIFTESDVPFLNEGVSILIDCSGYINKANKLFNMHLICGLTEGLNSIGIKYSVALISDEKFKRIIKKFDTPHNMYELQKIYECYMIPRYRTNLAKSLHFATDNLKFKSYHHNDNINSNTAFFVFTDGMDENLSFGKEFKDYLFNNPNLSFGFIFIKSSLLSEDDIKTLNDLWDNFKSKTKGSKSKVLIEIIENKYDIKMIVDVIKMFVNILSRDIVEESYDLNNYTVYNPIFEIPYKEELDINCLNEIKNCLEHDLSTPDEIFYSISQIHYNKYKAEKLDSNLYNNKIGNIINCKVSDNIKNDYNKFLKDFIIPKSALNMNILDQIFMPNKASTMVLSTTGSEIDIPAFIKYLFENNPNPMIYLEKKGGFTKHYSVSIIIDSSYSCLNNFSFPHTIQIIRILISNISSINIPAVDIIIATDENPIVICSDVPSNKLLGKINVLTSIFKALSKPCLKANILSALKVAKDLQQLGSKDTTKYMFVFTDGLYQQNELDLIKNRIFDCMQTSLLIGVGIGFYPLKIKKLFVQNIYVPNPHKLFSAIGISSSKINEKSTSKMSTLKFNITEPKSDIIDDLLQTESPINKDLIEEMKSIDIEMDAFSDIYNPEGEEYDNLGNIINPTGKNKSMFAEGLLEGHKLLFVCLYNCDMNPNEDRNVDYKYLKKTSPKTYFNLKQCADYYKVEIEIVFDYEDAIKELTDPWENDYNKGKYYAAWILCGPPYPILPAHPKKGKTNPYLLGQFMEVLHKFNENGGSVVFLTESDPLFYQANLFLRDLELFDKNGKKVKVDLQLEGEHKGDTVLNGDKTGELKTAGLFNKSSQSFKNLTRASLSHNLFTYYEGYTIDYADYDKVLNSPFYPFARDSDGGVAGFFYPADIDKRGDIIFNCNYTSLYFTKDGSNPKNDGTYKYFENIIAWTARPECHLLEKCQIKDYRPNKVNFKIDYNKKWQEFKEMPKKEVSENDLLTMKTLFCIDNSGSVSGESLYHNTTREIFGKYYKSGDLIYLWGTSKKKINCEEFKTWNDNKEGHDDDTKSDLIADIIYDEINSGLEHLVIVTDGSVDSGCIDASDAKMKDINEKFNFHFKFVSVNIISSDGDYDRTVGAPYCRGDPSVTYIYSEENKEPEKLASLSNEQIALIDDFYKISSYNEFISKYEKLGFALEAQMYGKNADTDLLNKLTTMKNNILNSSLSTTEQNDFNKKYESLFNMCNGGLRNGDFQFKAY
jgi:hypothetical protein